MEKTVPLVLASSDHDIGWLRLAVVAVTASVCCQFGVACMIWSRPPAHIDAELVRTAPRERLGQVTPDELNAMGLAQDAAQRMFRAVEGTSADDQAWLMNHMVPELAQMYEENALKVILLARQLRAYYGAHWAVTVLSTTPLSTDLPPFEVEVLVRIDARGLDRKKAKDDSLLEPRFVKLRMTMVRTTKTVTNRDALLIQSVAEIEASDGA